MQISSETPACASKEPVGPEHKDWKGSPREDLDGDDPTCPLHNGAASVSGSRIVFLGENSGPLRTLSVHGKTKQLCRKSLFVFALDNFFRQTVITIVEWRWFDHFILLCIAINSLLLGIYQYRAVPGDDHYWLNELIDGWADHILWAIFGFESVLKIIGWGFVLDRNSYLRDPWNALDLLVVVSGLLERCGLDGDLTFLRLFRLLRPLRSLNAAPQMKILVNTALSSILKLGNVLVLGSFLFTVFGIVGTSLMSGVLYRHCHTMPNPVLTADGCWSWPSSDDDRLCGGNYMCEASGGYCGGHPADWDTEFKPHFEGGMRGLPWCEDSVPMKLFPETDFIHFDHIAGAFLLIFQAMTLEGWTDLMYLIEDSFSPWFAVLFFIFVIVFTNFFMLNVALAVVDEVQDQFTAEAKEEQEKAEASKALHAGDDDDDDVFDQHRHSSRRLLNCDPWYDCKVVRWCMAIAEHNVFSNFIMLVIAGNVINMCLSRFSLDDSFGWMGVEKVIELLELVFLAIFIVEMIIVVTALGPKGYVKNPITCFDGIVVVGSIVEQIVNKMEEGSGGGFLSVLRSFRLFRVMNKLANKWTKLKILLKAMYHTGIALKDWLILFALVLYIFTLMCMHAFAKQLRFEDPDSLDPLVPEEYAGDAWCPGPYAGRTWHFRQECIPRANFDTFTWGIVTVFQVMSGENWNTIMYAGMRASERWSGTWILPPTVVSAALFVLMILGGQTIFMSLFLSMLISKFDAVQDECQLEEERKAALRPPRQSMMSSIKSMTMMLPTMSNPVVTTQPKKSVDHGPSSAPGSASALRDITSSPESNAMSNASCDAPIKAKNLSRVFTESEVPTLPGQLPHTPPPDDPIVNRKLKEHSKEQSEGTLDVSRVEEVPREEIDTPVASSPLPPETEDLTLRDPALSEGQEEAAWPRGYALFLFSHKNTIRRVCNAFLSWKVTLRGESIAVFDNFILLCILLSTLCMMSLTPLSDPHAGFTKFIKIADTVFAFIFIFEMAVKLIAHGLLWGHNAYLKSGWNWLDGCVVLVSIIDLLPLGSDTGFLRVMRILRTFRPLRVVPRWEGLKVVVQTLFHSIGDLFGLAIASFLFLLIFALIFVMNLKGTLYACSPPDGVEVGFLGGRFGLIGDNFATPLCLGSQVTDGSVANGFFSQEDGNFTTGTCGGEHLQLWRRASADTPICVARCDPTLDSHPPGIEHLCHRKYTNAKELPSVCEAADRVPLYQAEEEIGDRFIEDMRRTLVVPCGGWSTDGQVAAPTAAGVSCRENFCPHAATPSEACASECAEHNFFCKDVCKGTGSDSPECFACRGECEAACMCEDFCTPLVLDAALCVEQGGSWSPVLSQNFNNILNALLTLFEIATTEGWVDVMYAASDVVDLYRQPVRDTNHGLYVVLFPLWIVLSFMFLLNLVIGVVVDNFADAKNSGQDPMITRAQDKQVRMWQEKWSKGRKLLHSQEHTFFGLRDLDKLHPVRVSLYRIVTHKAAEHAIMACIVLNTVVMALTIFPDPVDGWSDFQEAANKVFAGIFVLEAILKLSALHLNYFNDAWNQFDFVCVLASLIGIAAGQGAVTSVIRILRIARLFRLLRFLKELNRLFRCLIRSIPKLINVLLILILFLLLFTILGMSLFGTAKFGETFNDHGNFRTFMRGFVTLLRASTGEAWNEIMHDLAKDERDWFREDEWCTAQFIWKDVADDPAVWDIMKEKCLIENPNACGGSWNPATYFFWVAYTIVTLVMMLNVVVAVILEGYEEGRVTSEEDNIDACVEIWKKYDPNHKLKIPLKDALLFINEVEVKLARQRTHDGEDTASCESWLADVASLEGANDLSDLASRMKLKESRGKWRLSLTEENQVTFTSAARMILRLNAVDEPSAQALEQLDRSQHLAPKKDREALEQMERRLSEDHPSNKDLINNVAAIKLQRKFRESRKQDGPCEVSEVNN